MQIIKIISLYFFYFLTLQRLPIYLNLPLNTPQLLSQLTTTNNFFAAIKLLKAEGLILDIFWGLVEQTPENYDFSHYRALLKEIQKHGLKVQIIISFHSLSSKDFSIPLPQWVIETCTINDCFYKNSQNQNYNGYISLFADNAQIFPTKNEEIKRSPLEIYSEFTRQIKKNLIEEFSENITGLYVSTGPDGQLRYPSERTNKPFYCEAGDYQIFDKFAQQSAKKDSVNLPVIADMCGVESFNRQDCFGTEKTCESKGCCWQPGNKNTAWCFYKILSDNKENEFLNWYHNHLVSHGKKLMQIFRKIFPLNSLGIKIGSIHWRIGKNKREPEKHSGLIDLNGEESYSDFFKIAKNNNFKIVFGGIGLSDDFSCQSQPLKELNLFKKLAEKFKVDLIGENPHIVSSQNHFQKIKEDSDNLSQINLLRIALFENGEIQNFEDLQNFLKKMELQKEVKHYKSIIRKIVILEYLDCSKCDFSNFF